MVTITKAFYLQAFASSIQQAFTHQTMSGIKRNSCSLN